MIARGWSVFLVFAAVLLGGCEVVVTGGSGAHDGVSIWNATYGTDTRATIDGVDRYVICDDRVTELSYAFQYEGPLHAWTSYLVGDTWGDVVGRQTFAPGASGVGYHADHVRVTYAIHEGVAPLSAAPAGFAESAGPDGTVQPQGIVVVPVPQVIGAARLYLELDGAHTRRELVSQRIPVLANCTW